MTCHVTWRPTRGPRGRLPAADGPGKGTPPIQIAKYPSRVEGEGPRVDTPPDFVVRWRGTRQTGHAPRGTPPVYRVKAALVAFGPLHLIVLSTLVYLRPRSRKHPKTVIIRTESADPREWSGLWSTPSVYYANDTEYRHTPGSNVTLMGWRCRRFLRATNVPIWCTQTRALQVVVIFSQKIQ